MPWFRHHDFENQLETSGLDDISKNQIRQFAQQGYLIVDPEIPDFDALADSIIHRLKPFYKELPNPHDLRLQDAWTYCDGVKQIAIAPKILSILRLLYNREPIPFQTLNFPVGTQQATHSDTIHFQSYPQGFMCGVWIAFEDIDLSNGPLHYYPGSHKLPMFDLQSIGLDSIHLDEDNYALYVQYVGQLLESCSFKQEKLIIKKGTALIWEANLFHGGSSVLDQTRSRHSQVSHYFFEGCFYYSPVVSNIWKGHVHIRTALNHIGTGERVKHYWRGEEIDPVKLDSALSLELSATTLRRLLKKALKTRIQRLMSR